MPIATVSSKGQITVPLEVRTALGLRTGSRVQFLPLDDGNFEILPASKSVADLAGFLAPAPSPLTIEEMDNAVAASFNPDEAE